MKPKNKNTLLRIKNVCEITQQHYEPGRQDKCYKAVWRSFVFPVYPMHYRTFLNYINTPLGELADNKKAGSFNQLKLF